MARITMADLQAELAALKAQLASAPSAPSVASQHYKDRDLAVTCCTKTFRTTKGRDFHTANTHKNGKAIA